MGAHWRNAGFTFFGAGLTFFGAGLTAPTFYWRRDDCANLYLAQV
jgi:hypothetical protein